MGLFVLLTLSEYEQLDITFVKVSVMRMNLTSVIGYLAATLTTAAFLPQAIKTIRTRHTKDISLTTYCGLSFGIALWLVYGLMLGELPIILANSLSLCLTLTIFGLKLKYG